MTEYGFKVFHPSGQGQIDSNYQNFKHIATESDSVVKGKQTVVTSIRSLLKKMPYPQYVETPFMASKANGTYYHYIYASLYNTVSGDAYSAYSEGSFTIETTFWGSAIDEDAVNYGMRIRSPKGGVVFDSSSKWMNIVSVNTGSVNEFSTTDCTVVDADNNYFYLSNSSIIRNGTTIVNHSMRGFKKTSSTNIRIGIFEYADVIPDDPTYDKWVDAYTLLEIAAP